MDKIKIIGFYQPPTKIFDVPPPYPKDTPKFHLIYIKRCVIDVKTVMAQFIGQKKRSEDEG